MILQEGSGPMNLGGAEGVLVQDIPEACLETSHGWS
jgi:hypothetical protein